MTVLPNDLAENRLMMEVHYYSPWNFCGLEKDKSWGKMFYYWGKGYHFGDLVRDANWDEEGICKRTVLTYESSIYRPKHTSNNGRVWGVET